MGALLDLTGKRFGKLTVLKEVERTKSASGRSVRNWLCQCECGNAVVKSTDVLRNGNTKSCGCYRRNFKTKDLSGVKFGRLMPISMKKNNGMAIWSCKCDCGNTIDVRASSLLNGHTTSCGCYGRNRLGESKRIHSDTGKRLYKIYLGMKQRCYNPKQPSYKNYGGRGITICEEWLNDYSSFKKWSLKNGYSEQMTIDRIDNNKGYSPDNCRWTTRKEQNNNTRRCVLITYNGETHNITQWSEKTGIPRGIIAKRYNLGWSPKRIFETKPIEKYRHFKKGNRKNDRK